MPSDKPSPMLKAIVNLRGDVKRLDGRLADVDGRVSRIESDVSGLRREAGDIGIRLSTELVAVAGILVDIRNELRAARIDRKRLEDHEERLQALERKTA